MDHWMCHHFLRPGGCQLLVATWLLWGKQVSDSPVKRDGSRGNGGNVSKLIQKSIAATRTGHARSAQPCMSSAIGCQIVRFGEKTNPETESGRNSELPSKFKNEAPVGSAEIWHPAKPLGLTPDEVLFNNLMFIHCPHSQTTSSFNFARHIANRAIRRYQLMPLSDIKWWDLHLRDCGVSLNI